MVHSSRSRTGKAWAEVSREGRLRVDSQMGVASHRGLQASSAARSTTFHMWYTVVGHQGRLTNGCGFTQRPPGQLSSQINNIPHVVHSSRSRTGKAWAEVSREGRLRVDSQMGVALHRGLQASSAARSTTFHMWYTVVGQERGRPGLKYHVRVGSG